MKTKLSGDITTILYYCIMMFLLGNIVIFIFGSAVPPSYRNIVYVFSTLLTMGCLVAFLITIRFKNIYFDKDNLYVKNAFNNRLIDTIDLCNIIKITDGNFPSIYRLSYTKDGALKNILTIVDRSTSAAILELDKFPPYKFLYGKSTNKMVILKQNIIDKQRNIPT